MSNSIKKYERYARSIGMNLEQFDELTRRMTGFINKSLNIVDEEEKIPQAIVKNAFLAAPEIQERSKKEIAQKWNTSNKEMREFGENIAQMTADGLGCQRIKKELNIKASRGTLEKFCKDNNLVRGVQNG